MIKSKPLKNIPAEISNDIAKREKVTDKVVKENHKLTASIERTTASVATAIMDTTKTKNSILTIKNISSPPYFI